MLIAENLLPATLRHLKVANFLRSVPFSWDSQQKCLILKSSKRRIDVHGLRLQSAYFYAAFAFLQLFLTWKESSVYVKMHSTLFFTGILVNCYTHHVFYRKSDMIVSMFNGFLKFENKRNEKKWRPIGIHAKLTIMIVRFMAMSGIGLPIMYHLELLRQPCMPMYVGYFLADQCHGTPLGQSLRATWSASEILTKVLVFAGSYINWSFLMSGFCFHVPMGLLVKCHCLCSYIRLFHWEINSIKNVNKRTRSSFQIYREIQVMAVENRRIYSRYTNVNILISMMIIHIISLYSCVKLSTTLSFPMRLFYINLTFYCAFIILFIYGSMSHIYKASRRLYTDLRGNTKFQRDPWFRKYWRSCQIIKVYIGEVNFVDELTPLNFENFVISQTAGLLLLKR